MYFKHGYLTHLLGRKNVAALVENGVETPGDMAGVLYIPIEENWQKNLMKEMKVAGLKFDSLKA